MATINSEIEFQGNDDAFFTANAAVVYDAGIIIYHTDGRYKFADGVTDLSALPFLGGGNQTLAEVLANGNSTGNTDITSVNGMSLLKVNNLQSALVNTNETYTSSVSATASSTNVFYNNGISKEGEISITDTNVSISHTDVIDLNAPSVKKNGVEIVTVNDLPNFEGLKTGGTITVGTFGGSGVDNDIRVSAATWVVGTTYYSTSGNTDFLDIALSSAGLQRYVGLYGTNSNTITKVEGAESDYASYPTTPANSIVIGYVLVNDASASTTPDLSGYMLKADKATQATNITGTNDTTYITPLANAIKENIANKSSSFTASSTTTYPNTKALVDGLATKLFQMIFASAINSPADATTYYWGIQTAWGAGFTISTDSRFIYVTKSCTIKEVSIYSLVGGTIATTENATIYLETYNSTTKIVIATHTITSTFKFSDAGRSNKELITGLNITLTADTYIQAKILCPTYATNPTSVNIILTANCY